MRAPRLTALLVASALLAASLPARTLTADDGRSIEAEVLGFEGTEKVRIKRTDTGQVFVLPIASFARTDREALAEEAAKAALAPIFRQGAIVLELGRTRLDTRKTATDVPLVGGGVARDALVITEDDWGYSITLRNTTNIPVEGVRAEYMLFVTVDAPKNPGIRPTKRSQPGRFAFETLPASGRVSAKTTGITTRKTELKGNIVWNTGEDSKTRDTLDGIWLRVYKGDDLLLESASPPNLATTEKWVSAPR